MDARGCGTHAAPQRRRRLLPRPLRRNPDCRRTLGGSGGSTHRVHPALRPWHAAAARCLAHPPRGLRLRQGHLEQAALLLEGLDTHPDAVRALAGLYLARGETALALDLLERCTAGSDDDVPTVGETTMVGPLLALLVDVHLQEGNLDGADRAAQRLA